MSDSTHQLERLQAAYEASGDLAYDWNLVDDGIAWLGGNPASLGLPAFSELSNGEAFHQHIHPDDLTVRLEALSALYKGRRSFECEFRCRGGDGRFRRFHDRGVAVYGPDGRPLRLSGILRAVGGQRREPLRDRHFADYDELTGRYSRTRLHEALDQAIYYALRYDVSGAFMVVGVDKINVVNQAFGYEVADAIILAIGQRLDRCLRASDTVGRLGGDRFGVVLTNCPSSDVPQAAEKLLEIARNTRIDTPSGPIHVTVSVGAVVFPRAIRASVDAVTKAEIALQNAKRASSNSWSVYSYSEEQRRDHRRNMVVAEQVKRALTDERLALAFQPIVRASDHVPEMHECLLRMTLPDGELVPAGAFMPVVEELGLIRLIDKRVLELAIAQMDTHPAARLAVNVSALTATNRSWLSGTVAALRPRPEIAERLTVEITETAGLDDVEECARFVATLRDLGCRVALDDFGAGYTSFRHLKMLAVNMVKIDGSFVRDIANNPDNLIFIRTLIGLAGNFGLDTVAECVEHMEEATLLRDEGVQYLQGYAFGKPSLIPPWPSAAPRQIAAAPAERVRLGQRRLG
ncbi:MAG: EAL domain-containing protein [Alphaproteobacteria bacterium]|nr:EAL domain-containing protein [Alphaproteobacteria bacterium]